MLSKSSFNYVSTRRLSQSSCPSPPDRLMFKLCVHRSSSTSSSSSSSSPINHFFERSQPSFDHLEFRLLVVLGLEHLLELVPLLLQPSSQPFVLVPLSFNATHMMRFWWCEHDQSRVRKKMWTVSIMIIFALVPFTFKEKNIKVIQTHNKSSTDMLLVFQHAAMMRNISIWGRKERWRWFPWWWGVEFSDDKSVHD